MEKIKKFVIELKEKQKFRFARTIKEEHPEELKRITELTNFLRKDTTIGERIYCILNNINFIPKCPFCGKEVRYRGNGMGYHVYCSPKCAKNSKKVKEKYKKTCIQKYGYECNLSKGCDNRKKMEKNLIKKYGVKNVSQLNFVKDKKRTTYQKNHKEPHPLWGNTWYEIKLPSGKKEKVQGYERFAIDKILEKYNEQQIFISYKSIKKKIGEIIYKKNNKLYRYYPDFYIQQDNKIIEVKSLFTLKNNFDDLKLKRDACLDKGLNFEIWVMNYKGEIINNEEDTKKLLKKLKTS